ncbi:MAG: hypothetical protein Q8P25_03995 [Candidatus Curtissbacteria bacterium]|nr:hypothetical protein [Candidatus Curtissbacteria bacterium]
MERNIYEQNRLREISLRIANQLLLAENEPNSFGLEIHFCDTRFFEQEWGVELFRQPLLSAYLSDEDFPDKPKLFGTILDDYVIGYGRGYDNHLTLFAGSSPIIFGVRKGTGDFGDHETEHGILVYRSPYAQITDDEVREIIGKSFSEGKNAIEPDDKRPRRLFVANIESGDIVYNKPCMLDTHDNSTKVFLSRPLFGSELVNIALSGKYFVFLGRPERLGSYLEQKERFDMSEIRDLVSR